MTTIGMISSKFSMGDLVWAKMKGFSPWPGKLTEPTIANLRRPPGNYKTKPIHCVFFFGSNNFAWIQEDAIKPYVEFKETYSKMNKSHAFKDAISTVEDYIKNGGEYPPILEVEKPSKDSELATIFTGKGGKEEKAGTGGQQKDYSRQPFGKKGRKPNAVKSVSKASAAASNSHSKESDDVSGPPTKKSKMNHSESADDVPVAASAVTKNTSSKSGARNLVQRTSQYLLDTNSANNNSKDNAIDMGDVSAKLKGIKASKLKFGFIGLGMMGQHLLKNLISSGHDVTIWNRTPSKCKEFIKVGATKVTTPADVVQAADITFSCLADPRAVKEIVFGNCGILAEMGGGKGYVELTSIDPDTSGDISEAIIARGGRYLEAPLIGSGKVQAGEGNLTVIIAGDKSLFEDCNSCFEAISSHAYYMGGNIGDASKMGLVTSMLMGNLIGTLAESMALADRTGLSQKDLLEILSMSPMNCPTLISKGKAMIDGGFATEMPLSHMQKDLRLALQLGEVYEHPLPITASANEVFKHAKHLGYSEHDVAAVYIRSRF